MKSLSVSACTKLYHPYTLEQPWGGWRGSSEHLWGSLKKWYISYEDMIMIGKTQYKQLRKTLDTKFVYKFQIQPFKFLNEKLYLACLSITFKYLVLFLKWPHQIFFLTNLSNS